MPIVPGHQVVGTVDALGPNCRLFQPGQRAGVAWLGHTCGTCEFCTTGKANRALQDLDSDQISGSGVLATP